MIRFLLGLPKYSKVTPDLSVTIVIPAWNEEDFIAATIESILAQSYKKIDVIVVNDCSTDKTLEIASRYSQIKVITTDKNQGSKSRALNYALPFLTSDIFICVDADTILKPDAVAKLLCAFNDSKCYVASGFVISKEQSNFWQSARYGEYIFGQEIFKSAQQNANAVLVASGCFLAIRTEFVKKHGFSERTMAEDMDLTWQAVENGYTVTFVQDAICYVNDPYNYYTYENQVSRWYRGFFQNVKARKFNMFKHSIKLGIVSYSYMFMNLVAFPAFAIVMLLYPLQVFLSIAIWMSICSLFTIYRGWRLKENIWNYPKHIINSMLISPIVYYLYVKSFIQEIILNQRLSTWVKGH